MDALEHLTRLLAYDDWANREALASLRSGASSRALRLFAHVVATEFLWLDRMAHKPPRSAVWPEWNVAQCATRLDELPPAWRGFLRGLDARALTTEISYVNTKGAHYTNTVGDIVTHAVLHSAYHRGQIATVMRETGRTAAYTDFIHAVREGCFEPGGD